jgi:hypothetical protein
MKIIFQLIALLAIGVQMTQAQNPAFRTRNIILITADGLRWQEVFTGAERELIVRQHGRGANTNQLLKQFWREDAHERRKALFPFLWSAMEAQGQLWGNQKLGSVVKVKNGMNFSYPGYNELLTGFPDPRIDSNEKKPNPNVTVLEYLNNDPQFKGKVGVFSSWDVHSFIVNRTRSGLPGRSGFELIDHALLSPREDLLNRLLLETTPEWDSVCFDSFTHHSAVEFFKRAHPRALYVAYGETDDWAHEGQYGRVLASAKLFDQYIGEWWDLVQSLPDYKDQTTLLITTDHGRGSGLNEWRSHGSDVSGADNIWFAVIGPDTKPGGEMSNTPPATQSQIAATVAKFLGRNFKEKFPQADGPLPLWQNAPAR